MSRFKITIKTKPFCRLGSPVELTVRIKNVSRRDYYILPHGTPFEHLHTDCFALTCKGEKRIFIKEMCH